MLQRETHTHTHTERRKASRRALICPRQPDALLSQITALAESGDAACRLSIRTRWLVKCVTELLSSAICCWAVITHFCIILVSSRVSLSSGKSVDTQNKTAGRKEKHSHGKSP